MFIGTEFQILTPWNLIFLCNLSILYLGRYKLLRDDAKRIDRLCNEATEEKKREAASGQIYTRAFRNKFSSVIGI